VNLKGSGTSLPHRGLFKVTVLVFACRERGTNAVCSYNREACLIITRSENEIEKRQTGGGDAESEGNAFHEDMWGSGGITPPFLNSSLDGGESPASRPG
jgi:hypothetical protein